MEKNIITIVLRELRLTSELLSINEKKTKKILEVISDLEEMEFLQLTHAEKRGVVLVCIRKLKKCFPEYDDEIPF
jgi:hypothetical protein